MSLTKLELLGFEASLYRQVNATLSAIECSHLSYPEGSRAAL